MSDLWLTTDVVAAEDMQKASCQASRRLSANSGNGGVTTIQEPRTRGAGACKVLRLPYAIRPCTRDQSVVRV